MPGRHAFFLNLSAVLHENGNGVPCGNLDVVHLFQKNLVVKFWNAKRSGAGFFQLLVDDGSGGRAMAAFLLGDAAFPVILGCAVFSFRCAVDVAVTAVWAFDLAGEAAGVQCLVGKRPELPAPCNL